MMEVALWTGGGGVVGCASSHSCCALRSRGGGGGGGTVWSPAYLQSALTFLNLPPRSRNFSFSPSPGAVCSPQRQLERSFDGLSRFYAEKGDSSASTADVPAKEESETAAESVSASGEGSLDSDNDGKESTGQEDIGKSLNQLRKERLALGTEDPSKTSEFWKGVLEETTLIEWPPVQKVLGTTGVVIGIIVGSSLVLLTVNAILAELSDNIFNNPALKEGAKAYLERF